MTGSTKPVIGLLGGPGSGKSYVAQKLAAEGAAIIDADVLAKQALETPEVRGTLTQWWGGGVIAEDGGLNRSAIGQIVFDNPPELARLESLIHPRVNRRRRELRELHQADDKVTSIVEDCPLLLERKLEGDCDLLVFVDSPYEVRLRRVADSRGWSAEELVRREKNQMPLDIKRSRADYVVQNGEETPFDQTQARRLLGQAISKNSQI